MRFATLGHDTSPRRKNIRIMKTQMQRLPRLRTLEPLPSASADLVNLNRHHLEPLKHAKVLHHETNPEKNCCKCI